MTATTYAVPLGAPTGAPLSAVEANYTTEIPSMSTSVCSVPLWTRRKRTDPVACALFDRHYSRRASSIGSGNCIGPMKHLVFVTEDETAVWASTWPRFNADGLDVWRCSIFHNEGEATSSDLIRSAMRLTAELWAVRPTAPAGWATFVNKAKVESSNPGYCFLKAGWWKDPEYQPDRRRRDLIRLRAVV